VLAAADRLDPELARRIEAEVRFPTSVVDRMVPATTDEDLVRIEQRLGVQDLAAVVAERHRSWVIGATDGLPPLGDVGVEVVADTGPYERRKLWLLNGPHSAFAYCGLLAGCTTVADAVSHPGVRAFVGGLVDDVLEVVDLPTATRPRPFADEAVQRFANAALGHTCAQVGADGSQKVRERLLPVVGRRDRLGLDVDRFALVVAIWLAAVGGVPVPGASLPTLDDPAAERLASAVAGGDLEALVAAALGDEAGRSFPGLVVDALRRLSSEGAAVLQDAA
jgi:fructuronate reductase